METPFPITLQLSESSLFFFKVHDAKPHLLLNIDEVKSLWFLKPNEDLPSQCRYPCGRGAWCGVCSMLVVSLPFVVRFTDEFDSCLHLHPSYHFQCGLFMVFWTRYTDVALT